MKQDTSTISWSQLGVEWFELAQKGGTLFVTATSYMV